MTYFCSLYSKIWQFICFLLIFFYVEINGIRYKIVHEDIKIASYNKDYMYNVTGVLFDYNATSKAYNLSCYYIRDLPMDIRAGLSAYKLQGDTFHKISNTLAPGVCEMFEKNEFGIRSVYDYTNFRGCPIKANISYYVHNFMLADEKIPQSMMIPGRFKIGVRLYSKRITYGDFEWYVNIVPDN